MTKMYRLRMKNPNWYIFAKNGQNVPAENKEAPSRYIFAQNGQNVPAENEKPPAGTFLTRMAKMYRLGIKNP